MNGVVASSFRDPSGFIFNKGGVLYRQINRIYKEQYDHLVNSGLYHALTNSELLIPHEEVDITLSLRKDAYRVLKPEIVGFVSYPYEWCFSQLKAAALTTLQIQQVALQFDMTLKDCSAYNIQFNRGKPQLIDTLSFEKYQEGEPWIGYRQFCQHFLSPLALTCYRDVRLNQLLRANLDGIPLDLTSSLLPLRTRFNFSLLVHIHLHSLSQKHYEKKIVNKKKLGKKVSRTSLLGLIDSLESAIKRLRWSPKSIGWDDYYISNNNYIQEGINHKKQLVSEFLDIARPQMVWDLGANTGLFSRIASDKGIQTICFDLDPACVEINYLSAVKNNEPNILPLILDLANPSPGIGWGNNERTSFMERGGADTVMALALIHHLVIANNIPLDRLAAFLKRICNSLIIEFVPKSDSNVKRLLSSREDVFDNYSQHIFEKEFNKLFVIERCENINNSERSLYLMVGR